MHRHRFVLVFLIMYLVLPVGAGWVGGWESVEAQDVSISQELGEMALIQRVAELQRQLESSEIAQRESAEKKLLELGVRVLDHLEPLNEDAPSDAVERLLRVRLALEKIAVAAVTEPSRATVAGELSVTECLTELRKQTQNDVDLSDRVADSIGEQKIDLQMKDAPFWDVLRTVMEKAHLQIDPYGGQPGQLRLVPASPRETEDLEQASKVKMPRVVSGIFDLAVIRVSSLRDLANPKLNHSNISLKIVWEPRVQPISIELPLATIKAIDEFDEPIDVGNAEAVLTGIVQPEIPELEFSIPIGLVDRQIENIKTFSATLDAVLPGRVETFRFKKIDAEDEGKQQKKAGAIVTFGGIRKNDDLYGVTVGLSFDQQYNALESHQGWAFTNPMFLEDENGNKLEPIAYETLRQDDQQIMIQFYFQENPDNMTLVYQTPAAIVQVPVEVELNEIPLP